MLGGYRYQSIRTGLVGHWRPSRGPTGNTLIDSVRGNHGTLTNGPTWTPSAGGGTGGYALSFDGTDDFVNIGSSQFNFGSGNFCLSGWFFHRNNSTAQTLIGKDNNAAGGRQFVLLAPNVGSAAGSIAFAWFQGDANGLGVETSPVLSANTWNHILVQRTGASTSEVYLNGLSRSVTTTGTANGTLQNNSIACEIGRRSYSGFTNPFSGLADDVAIFARSLSASEILTLYQAGRGALDQRVNVTVVRGATTSTGTGSASITEANDTVSSAATIAIAATAGITEASDTVASASTIASRATLAVTEDSDTCVGASTIISGITGTTGATEADDTLTSASTIALRATAGISEADDIVTSASTLLLRAVLAVTEASDSLSSASTISDVGLPPQIDGSPYAAWYVQNTEAW